MSVELYCFPLSVRLSICCCGHSNFVIFNQISEMAIKTAAYGQFALVEALSQLSPDFFQISYMNYFYQTLTNSDHKFSPMNDNNMAARMAASLLIGTYGHSNLV